jgi:hypothetical protein
MRRFVLAAALGALLAASPPAQAQPGGFGKGGDAMKKMQADLDRLRDQIKGMEDRINKLSEGGPKKDFRGPGAFPPGKGKDGKKDFAEMQKIERFKEKDRGGKEWDKKKELMKKEFMEKFAQRWREAERKSGDKKGPPGDWSRPNQRRGDEFRGGSGRGSSADIERRLERITRELEEIRRELHRR